MTDGTRHLHYYPTTHSNQPLPSPFPLGWRLNSPKNPAPTSPNICKRTSHSSMVMISSEAAPSPGSEFGGLGQTRAKGLRSGLPWDLYVCVCSGESRGLPRTACVCVCVHSNLAQTASFNSQILPLGDRTMSSDVHVPHQRAWEQGGTLSKYATRVHPCFRPWRATWASPWCCWRSWGLKPMGSAGALVLGGLEVVGESCGSRKQLVGCVTGHPGSLDHAIYFCTAKRSVWDWTANQDLWSRE